MPPTTLRGRRRYGARVRKDALPAASAIFIFLVAALGVWYSTDRSAQTAARSADLLSTTTRSASEYGDLCTGDGFFKSKASLAILIPGIIHAFVGLAIVTDDYFVAALERICERLNLSEDVAGATFMAAGSSTPEFFASLLGVFVTEDEVGIGTIVGSAVFNILVIIGLSAALAGSVLKLDWRPLVRDSFFYVVSIVLLLLFVLPVTKGRIDWWEGLILVLTYGVYVGFMAYGNKPYMKWAGSLGKKRSRPYDVETGMPTDESTGEGDVNWDNTVTPSVSQEKRNYHDLTPRSKFRAAQYAVIAANRLAAPTSGQGQASDEDSSARSSVFGIDLPHTFIGWLFFPSTFFWQLVFKVSIIDCADEKRAHLWWLTFLTSILWISGISYIMVEAARLAGCLIGIPASAMGLTVIAAGTSVPDALASIAVAREGAADMAVSNAIGSNVFDILLGLGFPWFLGHLIKGQQASITVEPLTTVIVPILILFAIIITLVVLLIILRWQLRPLLGYLLFGIYGLFLTYTLLDVYVFKLGS